MPTPTISVLPGKVPSSRAQSSPGHAYGSPLASVAARLPILGVADSCAPAPVGKGHTAAGGADAIAAMALSTATTVFGVTQISEIKAPPGVKLVGEYPAAPINLQVKTVYSAIIVEGTQNLAGAQLLLRFLSGEAFKTQLAAYGFDPIAAP